MANRDTSAQPDGSPPHASSDVPGAEPRLGQDDVANLRAVNERLLLASLREHVWADVLQGQLAFARAITQSLSEGVLVLDQTGRITLVNAAAEHMLGWREADLIGLMLHDAIPMRTRDMVPTVWEMPYLSKIAQGEISDQHVAITLSRRDGQSFDVLYSAVPIVMDTQIVGIVITFRDMTEVYRLHQIQEAYIALLSEQQTLLAQQVHERTSELEHATKILQMEIQERKRSEQTRQQLLVQLVSAQEEERRRIARELHDQMGQNVTALLLAIKALHPEGTADLPAQFMRLHALGTQIGQDVRTLAVQLRPPTLDDFGLLPTITTYVEQWSVQTLIAIDLYTTGLDDTRVPAMIETSVFRIVQESLTNIMRHAQARHVSVIIHRRSEALHIIVEDDGIGFDRDAERQRSSAEQRFGLVGMEERVAQLAGKLTIESTPGRGTTIFVVIPLTHV